MYTNLTTEQSAKLAQSLGPEFTASAKNDLLNFADAVVGLVSPFDEREDFLAKADLALKQKIEDKNAAKAEETKAVAPSKAKAK